MDILSAFLFGLIDSFNPCNLSTAILLASFLAWLRKRQESVLRVGWGVVITCFFSSLLFLLGFLMSVLYSDWFFQFGRFFYSAIGAVFMVFGGFHFADWVRMVLSKSLPRWSLTDDGQKKRAIWPLLKPLIIIPAIVLSALSTVWPMNRYVSLFALDLGNPSEMTRTVGVLSLYSLMMMTPLALAIFWLPLSAPGGWIERNPTMAKMIASSVLIGLGFGLIYVFH